MTGSLYDFLARSRRLDGLRGLLDDPQLLAADSPARPLLAVAETLAIRHIAASVDCDVDHGRTADVAMAACWRLHHSLDVDSCRPSILGRPVDLLAIRKTFQ